MNFRDWQQQNGLGKWQAATRGDGNTMGHKDLDSFGHNDTIRHRDNVRNPLADCMRVIRLLGQADALGYVGEQAAPIMEEALSLASDLLKREVK
jgi:hypothetical protein